MLAFRRVSHVHIPHGFIEIPSEQNSVISSASGFCARFVREINGRPDPKTECLRLQYRRVLTSIFFLEEFPSARVQIIKKTYLVTITSAWKKKEKIKRYFIRIHYNIVCPIVYTTGNSIERVYYYFFFFSIFYVRLFRKRANIQ